MDSEGHMDVERETQLLDRARHGDEAAFEALVQTHARGVYNLAFRILRHEQEAEDVFQEAFLRAWRNLATFRGQARFSTWMYRIVTNLCYDRHPTLRRDLDALTAEVPEKDWAQDPQSDLETAELQRWIAAALEALPDGYRMLLTLRHFHGLSYLEISQVAGLPLGTVKTGIHRGRNALKALLAQHEEPYVSHVIQHPAREPDHARP